jgi:hypothetical protein
MFDYQAGEKYKLTLVMVGVTGIIVGASLTLFLATPSGPPPRASHGSRRPANYEARGSGSLRSAGGRVSHDGGGPDDAAPPPVDVVDKGAAQSFVQGFLNLTWDFNSTTSGQSQERAMTFMTPDCAQNYKVNIWTPEMAQTVAGAGMTSSFTTVSCQAITSTDDGSVVVKVVGDQTLNLQGQAPKQQHKIMEYLVKKTPQGLKISGISESENFGT